MSDSNAPAFKTDSDTIHISEDYDGDIVNAVKTDELEELIESWSGKAGEAAQEGNIEFSLGVSCCADQLRELLEDH